MAGGGGRLVASQVLHDAELDEGAGVGGPITGLACNGDGDLVQRGGLIPVAVGAEEAAHRGGDGDGVPGLCAGGGMAGGRVQVRSLGFQPAS